MLNKEVRIPLKERSLPEFDDSVEINPPQEIERVRLPRNKQSQDLFQQRPKYNWDYVQIGGGSTRKRRGYVLSFWTWLAAIIDGLVLTSLSGFFIVGFTLVMKTTITETFLKAHGSFPMWKEFVMVYVLASWVYMISTRILMSASLGEWACDIRLGQPHERFSRSYGLRVILRSTLIVATGMVTLPVLSLLLGRDIPGDLAGIKLYSLK